jgi:hypothetical protein
MFPLMLMETMNDTGLEKVAYIIKKQVAVTGISDRLLKAKGIF